MDDEITSEAVVGTSDWKELSVEFFSKDRTEVHLGPRFEHFGSCCMGTAWCDDLVLEEVAEMEVNK